MADRTTIQHQLERFAQNYGKKPEWVEALVLPWSRSLEPFPDRVVVEACTKALEEEQWAPNLAKLRMLCEKRYTVEAAGPPRSCPRCSRGIVSVARHVDTGQRVVVEEVAARCSCPRGQSLSAEIGTAEDLAARWRTSPSTLEVYVDPTYEQLHPEMGGTAARWANRGPGKATQAGRELVERMTAGVDVHAAERERHLARDRYRELVDDEEGRHAG